MDRLQKLIELRDTQIGVVKTLEEKGYAEKGVFRKQKELYQKEVKTLSIYNSQIEREKKKNQKICYKVWYLD